jgi:MoxR-like ATPase
VFSQKSQEFEFRPGPVMAQIVLADEINRAPPKSQAALLECMAEGQITVDGTRHAMPYPFMVMATQNPIEYEGTYPLPETELDRFLLRLTLGYPAAADEIKMLQSQQLAHPIDSLEQVATQDELVELQHAVREIQVSPLVAEYIVSLAGATRDHAQLYLGASPRGSLGVFRMAQARALLDGRDFALPDDVKASIEPALAHRMVLDPSAQSRGTTMATVIADILGTVAVPGTLSS